LPLSGTSLIPSSSFSSFLCWEMTEVKWGDEEGKEFWDNHKRNEQGRKFGRDRGANVDAEYGKNDSDRSKRYEGGGVKNRAGETQGDSNKPTEERRDSNRRWEWNTMTQQTEAANGRGQAQNSERRGRPEWRTHDNRYNRPRKPMSESEKNFADQQEARSQARRIKMQAMIEREKEYKKKQADQHDDEEGEGEGEEREGEEIVPPDADDADAPVKDNGEVWGHDGYMTMVHEIKHRSDGRERERGLNRDRDREPNRERDKGHDKEPNREANKDREGETASPPPRTRRPLRKGEMQRYVPPRMRSEAQQEVWNKEQQERARLAEEQQISNDVESYSNQNKVKDESNDDQAIEDNSPKQGQEQTHHFSPQNGSPNDSHEGELDDDDEEETDKPNDEKPSQNNGDEILLILEVEIARNVSKSLQVKRGDNPKAIAQQFCEQNGMNLKFVGILADNIIQNLKLQEKGT